MNGWGLGFVFVIVSLFLYSFFVLLSFFCSFFTSITNLVQIQTVSFDFGSLAVNSSSTKTKTVIAKPDGMVSAVIPRIQNFCTVQAANLNGTSFSVTAQNQSNGTHTCNATVLLVYYPSTWNI